VFGTRSGPIPITTQRHHNVRIDVNKGKLPSRNKNQSQNIASHLDIEKKQWGKVGSLFKQSALTEETIF
jgi:hypothetical protein